jgi:hypothetical protein
MKAIGALAAALTVVFVSGGPAHASVHTHFGESAKHVAAEIGCKDYHASGAALYSMDGGICWLKGKRVNLKTFTSLEQEAKWNSAVEATYPSAFWWANGWGAVIVAKNGNKPAANTGADALPGWIRHG